MKTFNEFLQEKIINLGFTGSDEEQKNKYAEDIVTVISNAYKQIGGYKAITNPNEEKTAILSDLNRAWVKIIRRLDSVSKKSKITAVALYKPALETSDGKQINRKLIAVATNGELAGYNDLKMILIDDFKQQRAWAEVSGKAEAMLKKIGMPSLGVEQVKELLPDKEIVPIEHEPGYYQRAIAGTLHKKTAVGYAQKSS